MVGHAGGPDARHMVFEADVCRRDAERRGDELLRAGLSPDSPGALGNRTPRTRRRRESFTPQRTGPTPSSSTMTASCSARPEKRSSARQTAVPTVGWPAKGSSCAGVKMRALAECAGFSAGSTKTVSERLNSRAIACIAALSRPSEIEHDGKRISRQRTVGENIEDPIASRHPFTPCLPGGAAKHISALARRHKANVKSNSCSVAAERSATKQFQIAAQSNS